MEKYIELKLVDYSRTKSVAKIDENKLENMICAIYEIISGDEILTIIYKNGEQEKHDTCNYRYMDFNDERIMLLDKQELLLINKLKSNYSYDRADKLKKLIEKHRG